jgi:hypothetical protein
MSQQEELCELAENDSAGFWRKMNSMCVGSQRDSKVPLAVEIDGEIETDIKVVMEKWRDDFKNIFAEPTFPQFDNDHLTLIETRLKDITKLQERSVHANEQMNLEMHADTLNEPLLYAEVESAVTKMKNHKATGLDAVPAECFKNKTVIDLFFTIFSFCFEKGVVPDTWLKSMINPICKQGSIYEPTNYRGINLVNVMCKCYSSISNRTL